MTRSTGERRSRDCALRSGVAGGLPDADGFDGMDKHDDVEGEIVAHPEEASHLEDNDEAEARDSRRDGSEEEAERHHENVAARIQNAVTDVSLSDGRFPIAV